MSRKGKNKQSGMTLIEVLISLAMVGGLIVLYAAVFNISLQTRTMKYENLAYHIASRKMEDIRNTPYGTLPASASFADPLLTQLPLSAANFTINDFITYSGLKEVVVTVNWTDRKSRNVVIRTLIGTGGINP
jgi:prepilin-type N-terminal cleavage/methylation domain-containing protein